MHAKVGSVKTVRIAHTRSNPPGLIIVATGMVPTSGWGDGELVPRMDAGASPPQDGVWDLDFIARPPSGPVLDVESEVAGSLYLPPDAAPHWLTGFRVHASRNAMEASVGPARDGERAITLNWVPSHGPRQAPEAARTRAPAPPGRGSTTRRGWRSAPR